MYHGTQHNVTDSRLTDAVEENKEIVADYLQWYIINRNSSVIDRLDNILKYVILFFFMFMYDIFVYNASWHVYLLLVTVTNVLP